MDWIHLAQDTVQWQALMKTKLVFRYHKIPEIFYP
jgi:hypothetical protein